MEKVPFSYLNYQQVCKLVGLTKTPIRCRIKAGTFPAPVALSSRCVRFRSDDIARWMEEQSKAVDVTQNQRITKATKAYSKRKSRPAAALLQRAS